MVVNVRVLLMMLALAALVMVVTDEARGQYPNVDISSGGAPLFEINIGRDLSCQVWHEDDPGDGQFYNPGDAPADCGTHLVVDGNLYTPNYNVGRLTETTGAFGAPVPFTEIAQDARSGSGAYNDPWKTKTGVLAGASDIGLTQVDTYVDGDPFYDSTLWINNSGSAAKTVILYRAADCYLGGSDTGYGAVGISAPGSIACTENPNHSPAGRIEEFIPFTGGSRYYHDEYFNVWTRIGSRTMFPDSCLCTVLEDNGMGLSWQLSVPAGGSQMVEWRSSFAIQPTPVAEFSWNVVSCQPPLVEFTSLSDASAGFNLVSERWEWGHDGASDTFIPTSPTPVSHTFPGPGTYRVNLTVSNTAGESATMSVDLVVPGCPNADFDCVPLTHPDWRDVAFRDLSTDPDNDIVLWEWDLGDGTNGTSYPSSFVHTYAAEASYTVTLRVVDDTDAEDVVSKPCFADDNHPPVIDPRPDIIVYEGQQLSFQMSGRDPDGDPVTWTWDRGGLPAGADWEEGRLAFTWTPGLGMAGTYGSSFGLTDPYWSTSEGFLVQVMPVPDQPQPSNADSDGDGDADVSDPCPAGGCDAGPDDAAGLDGAGGDGSGYDGSDGTGDGTSGGEPVGARSDPDRSLGAARDTDGDGVLDGADNCRTVVNPSQHDLDRDGIGDACDADRDGDRVPDQDVQGRMLDNCPLVANPFQEDADQDGIGDACTDDQDTVLDDGCGRDRPQAADDGEACEGQVTATGGDGVASGANGLAAVKTAWPWWTAGLAIAAAAVLVFLRATRRRDPDGVPA